MTTQRKRLVTIKSEINVESDSIRFYVWDVVNEKVFGGMDKRFDGVSKKLNARLVPYAVLDGVKDSARDAGALGIDATIQEKFAATIERLEYLTSGADSWTRGREAGEGTMLLEALMLMWPDKDRDVLRKKLSEMSASNKRKLENSDDLRPFMDKVREQRGRGVDVSELFAELDV